MRGSDATNWILNPFVSLNVLRAFWGGYGEPLCGVPFFSQPIISPINARVITNKILTSIFAIMK
jgi:hypothetical protein